MVSGDPWRVGYTASTSASDRRPLTKAEKSRLYRLRLKQDPERQRHKRMQDALRAKRYREQLKAKLHVIQTSAKPASS